LAFTLLVWSADAFTDNGAKIARIFNISPLIIGLLIFGFGTSAPEMLVSGLAAYDGHPELSIGNAFGSNIFNIGLVLAVAAIIHPVIVEKSLKKRMAFLFLSTFSCIGFLLMDGFLSFLDRWLHSTNTTFAISYIMFLTSQKKTIIVKMKSLKTSIITNPKVKLGFF